MTDPSSRRASAVLLAATIGALAGGCGGLTGPAAEKAPAGVPAPPAGDRVNAGPLQLFDGFEEDSISGFWLPGDHGSGRHEPGAVAVSGTYARSGKGSVCITVQEGDIEQTGDGGQATERAELDSGRHAIIGRDVWYGFSFLIPPGFPVVENRLVIAQWKQSGIPGGPMVGQRYRGGTHHLTIRDIESPAGARTTFMLPDIQHGTWSDMVYHLRFSTGADGLVEAWMNGGLVVLHRGPTASTEGKAQIYNKIGLYRDRWPEPMTIYFDNYTVGDSFEAVDPARFDRAP